jgi:hypothetical protein
MTNIDKILKFNLNFLFKENIILKPQFSIQTGSIASNDILTSYFGKYYLFSSKYLNYKDWVLNFNMFKEK